MNELLIFSMALVSVASGASLAGYRRQPIAILGQSHEFSHEGTYNHGYETENGISVAESGAPGPFNEDGQRAVVAQGHLRYTSPEGIPITLSYVADEHGFRAQGAHLPVAPAIPPQIQRGLDFIAAQTANKARIAGAASDQRYNHNIGASSPPSSYYSRRF